MSIQLKNFDTQEYRVFQPVVDLEAGVEGDPSHECDYCSLEYEDTVGEEL